MAVKQKRKSYDDKFRAGAIVMLQAQGYPANKYKLEEVARHLGVPTRTLRRWYMGEHGKPPDDVVQEQKAELVDRLQDLANKLVDTAMAIVEDTDSVTIQQVVTSLGIVIDKKQLLEGKATERKELTGKDGGAIQSNITVYSDLSDDELDLIINGQSPFSEGREGKTEYTQ